MNILKRELRANLKALIIWCVIIIFLLYAGMYKFNAMGDSGLANMMSGFPKVILVVFGAVPGLNLGTAEGFFGMLYTYILIMAGVYAVLLGSGIISKEERDKTTEFLVVRPVTRKTIILQKLIAALVNTVIFDLVFLLVSIAALSPYTSGADVISHVLLMTLGVLFFQLVFLSIGTVFAASFKDSKRSGMFAVLILLVTYLINIIAGMTDSGVIRVFSPFAYFLPSDIISGAGFSWAFALVCAVIFAALTFFTFRAYDKRDLAI